MGKLIFLEDSTKWIRQTAMDQRRPYTPSEAAAVEVESRFQLSIIPVAEPQTAENHGPYLIFQALMPSGQLAQFKMPTSSIDPFTENIRQMAREAEKAAENIA